MEIILFHNFKGISSFSVSLLSCSVKPVFLWDVCVCFPLSEWSQDLIFVLSVLEFHSDLSLVFLNKFTGRVPQEICWICKLTSFSSGEFPWISSLSFPRLHLLLFSLSGCLMIKMLDLPDRSKLFFFSRLFSTPLASHSFFSGTFSQPLSQNFY